MYKTSLRSIVGIDVFPSCSRCSLFVPFFTLAFVSGGCAWTRASRLGIAALPLDERDACADQRRLHAARQVTR